MTEPLVDLRKLVPPAKAKRTPYRKRSASKPWMLPDEGPLGSFRELIAAQVRNSVRPEDTLSDIHRRFCARFKCEMCGQIGTVCGHRDRVADLRMILRREG